MAYASYRILVINASRSSEADLSMQYFQNYIVVILIQV